MLEPASLLVQRGDGRAECVGRLKVVGFTGEDKVVVVEQADEVPGGYEELARDMLGRALGEGAGKDVIRDSYRLFEFLDPEDKIKAIDLETRARIGLGWQRFKAKSEIEQFRARMTERERNTSSRPRLRIDSNEKNEK